MHTLVYYLLSIQWNYCSVTQSCPTLCNPMSCSMPGFPVLHHLPKLIFIELVMPSNHIFLHHPLLLLSVFPSIRVFSIESALCISWPKYWSFSFSVSPSSKFSGFRIDWFDLLAIQGTGLESSPTSYSSKASILWHSAFFMVRLSHLYMTTGNATALTRRTFVGKVMSLLYYTMEDYLLSMQWNTIYSSEVLFTIQYKLHTNAL